MTPSEMVGDSLPDEHRLATLIASHCDADLSENECAELATALLSSEDARGRFIEELSVHGWLEMEMPAQQGVFDHIRSTDQASTLLYDSEQASVLPRHLLGGNTLALAAAACLLLSATVASLLLWRGGADPLASDPRVIAASQTSTTDSLNTATDAIAQACPVEGSCDWRFDRQNLDDGEQDSFERTVRAGDTLRVTQGRLRLVFAHGTEVDLQAPALYEVGSAMRTRLFRGRATVNVAEGAEGFTIDTPGASVIDLGTKFGVEVDDEGQTDVVVFQGMVDVSMARDLGEGQGAGLDTKRLFGGGAMHINRRGTASRIYCLPSDRFSNGGELAASLTREPLITAVSDNLKRRETWNFYEIVSGGMREDCKAFVDREHHEWNGIDEAGMPSYLLDGDYVRTFNDDKVAGQIVIDIELRAPTQLYVLWDNRVEPPSWLVRDFEPTGDSIGVDEGDHIFPTDTPVFRKRAENNREQSVVQRGPAGEGPGQSIDAHHSVWRRVVERPGTVTLGSLETKLLAINMYGIVATPLDVASR